MKPRWGVGSMARRPAVNDFKSKVVKAVMVMAPVAKDLGKDIVKEAGSSLVTDFVEKDAWEMFREKLEDKGKGGAADKHQDQHLGANDNDTPAKEHERYDGHHTNRLSLLEGLEEEGLPYIGYLHLVEVVGGEKKAYLARIEVIGKPPLSSLSFDCQKRIKERIELVRKFFF